MKRKINNPYDQVAAHNCFACSRKNASGLRMHFYEEGDFVCSQWHPRPEFCGYHNILHGGIQATLIDEIASWCMQIKLKTAGVTSRLETRYKKPVYSDRGSITLKARVEELKRNIACIHVVLQDTQGQTCAEGRVQYFMFSEQTAKEKYYYPDYEDFFK